MSRRATGRAARWPLAHAADGIVAELAHATGSPRIAALDGEGLLAERAMLSNLQFGSGRSPGDAARLLRAGARTLAVNLPRPSDWEAVPAWLEIGDPAWPPGQRWQWLRASLSSRDGHALLERARVLGLAVASADRLEAAPHAPWRERALGAGHTHSARAEIGAEIDAGHTPIAAGHTPRCAGHTPPAPGARPIVLDLSALWAGPLATHLLQLAGAEVVKVEALDRPDGARSGNAGFYGLLNQGKRSVALDLRTNDGRAALKRLIAHADIVVEAARPRALRQLGIEPRAMMDCRPGLTWVSITGYGREPPNGDWVAFGDDAGAAAGLCELMRRATGQYQFAGDAIADPLTGLHAALAAWRAWQAGGGCLVELSLCGVASWCTARTLAERGAERVLAELGHWWNAAASCPNGSPAARASSHALAGHRLREVEQPVAAFGEHTEQVLARCVPC
jgi:hypothetical protein